jgi:POT family proton-dependent oligopeptide transporter
MMGIWFLASAYGQYIAGQLGAGMALPNKARRRSRRSPAYTDGYRQLAVYALVCGVALIALAPVVRRLSGERRRGEDDALIEELK